MGGMDGFKDHNKLRSLLQTWSQAEGVKSWLGLAVLILTIFWVFSSGDFSFLLTLSSLVSMFSFFMVAMAIESGKTVKGVSLTMMECYILVFFFRLCATVPFEGYLPFDKSGDWVYQVCEAFTLCLAGTIVYCCRVQYRSTYEPSVDNFNHLWIVGPVGSSPSSCTHISTTFSPPTSRGPSPSTWSLSQCSLSSSCS
jgi:hypothetical protein